MQISHQMKTKIRRISAGLLSTVLLITGIQVSAFAEDAYESHLNGWQVQCSWSTASQDYEWNATTDVIRQPKIRVTYRIENAEQDYEAGSIQFTVPGIGNTTRGKVEEAYQVAADAEDSEWNYEWDSKSDMYTFTNKFEVAKGTSVSGGFEMLWRLTARECADGFEQRKSPVFTLIDTEGGESQSITMHPLTYRFRSLEDRYRISMSSSGLTLSDYDTADKDYVWYDIETSFGKDRLARGLYKANYHVSLDLPEEASADDVQIIYEDRAMELTQEADGSYRFYPFRDRYGDIGAKDSAYKNNFQAGFRKATLEGKTIQLNGLLERQYLDESEWVQGAGTSEQVEDSLGITVTSYGFHYDGYSYKHSIQGNYESSNGRPTYDYTSHMSALNLYNGKIVQFKLTGSANLDYTDSAAFGAGRADIATSSNASHAVTATPSNAERSLKEDIPEGIEDWNDIHWRENRQFDESNDIGGLTYRDIHPEYEISSPSDASDWEISDTEADTATPSDASDITDGHEADYRISTEQYGIREYTPYSMMLGDDKLAIVLNDATIRSLDDDEYDIAYITVPYHSKGYEYEIYTSNTQDASLQDAYIQNNTGDTKSSRTFRFDEGVKAVYINVLNMKGSSTISADVGVRLHLDWTTQQELEKEKRPDHEACLVNFSYQRVLYRGEDGEEVNDCSTDKDSYEGVYGMELAERDYSLYGEYLLRDYSNVWLRSSDTQLRSGTILDSFKSDGSGSFTSRVQTSGSIEADSPGTLERFSLYTVLPDGVRTDFDNTPITIAGNGKHINGGDVSNEVFTNHAVISMAEYQGDVLLKVDFDFSDNPLEAGQNTWISTEFPITLSAADFVSYGSDYRLDSYLMAHDDGLDRIGGDYIKTDYYDIDGDVMMTERMAYSYKSQTVHDDVSEWRQYVSNYVKSAFSDGSFVMDTVTGRYSQEESEQSEEKKAQSEYSYRLDFGLEASNAKDIWFFDRIEQGAHIADNKEDPNDNIEIPSAWRGELLSVDTSFVRNLGLIPTVYYSEDAEQELIPGADGWSTQKGDTVRAVAVSLDTSRMDGGVLKMKQMAYILLNMRAPAEERSIGKKAVNQYQVQYAIPSVDEESKNYTLASAETYVTLMDSAGKLVLQNVDADHQIQTDSEGKPVYAALTGAEFQVYDSNKKPLFDSPKEVNALGRIVLNHVTDGNYYWEEKTAPRGYVKRTGQHLFMVDGLQGVIQIENKRKLGSVILTNYDGDSAEADTLTGAAFELYRVNGEQVYTQTSADGNYIYAEDGTNGRLLTGDDGGIHISKLPWGSYYFVVTQASMGYEIEYETKKEQIPFSIGRENFGEENEFIPVEVEVKNKQLPASVRLTKTDEVDGTVLKDAYYDLSILQDSDNWRTLQQSLYTNAAGELIVEGLKFGDYRLQEVQPPGGYEQNTDPVTFTLDASTVETVQDVSHTGIGKKGTVVLMKFSQDEIPLKDAVFTLYRDMGDGVKPMKIKADLKTNEDGMTAPVPNLDWGKYYFKETQAPNGYVLSEDPVEFTVDADNVNADIRVKAVNKRMPGSVLLTKMDKKTETLKLGGAVFSLYRQDGTLVQSGLTTSTDETDQQTYGTIKVDSLDWGSYYFVETKAPVGYGLYTGKIRFSINGQNSRAVQALTSYAPEKQVQITIHKNINEHYLPFGTPTFLFKIAGESVNKEKREWFKSLTLDQVNTGTVVLSGIPAGTYTVTELEVERYCLKEVRPGSNMTLGADSMSAVAVLGMADGQMEAEVTFDSVITQYEMYSHVTESSSLVNAKRKAAAFEVMYKGPEIIKLKNESEYRFTEKDLDAVVQFDDGTSEEVAFDELTLNPETIMGDDNGGSFTVTVTCEVDEETLTDTFIVEVEIQKPKRSYTITYDANGVYFNGDVSKRMLAIMSREYFNNIG